VILCFEQIMEYMLGLICLTALFTYLIDTKDVDEVFETAVLLFRSLTVMLRVCVSVSNVSRYSRQTSVATYSQVDFDLVQDVQVTDDEHGVITYE